MLDANSHLQQIEPQQISLHHADGFSLEDQWAGFSLKYEVADNGVEYVGVVELDSLQMGGWLADRKHAVMMFGEAEIKAAEERARDAINEEMGLEV